LIKRLFYFLAMIERYHKFSHFLKQKYGEKVWKISLDAGLRCPNCTADGKEGCIYCRNDSFSRKASLHNESINEQMARGIDFARSHLGIKKYIAYFQASTNTFAPASHLEQLYNQALSFDGLVGVSISTRPDCLPSPVIELLSDLSKRTDLWIELGLQSSFDKTLELINRGHTFQDFLDAVEKLKKINARICAHLMLGLPGEGRDEILITAQKISRLDIHEVKLHPVLILRDTKLENMLAKGLFSSLTLSQYAQMVVEFIELLPESLVIQRMTAEAPREMLVAPDWSMNKLAVLNAIEAEFQLRDTYQGKKYKRG